MDKLAKKYNNILQAMLITLPVLWIFHLQFSNIISDIINVIVFIFIAFTTILSIYTNRLRKMHSEYILITICAVATALIFALRNTNIELSDLISLMSIVIFPLSLIIFDEVRISDRCIGTLVTITGIVSLLKVGDINYLTDLSKIILPLILILLYREENLLIKALYILTNCFLLNILFNKLYIIILFVLLELAISLIENKKSLKKSDISYLLIYLLGFILIILKQISPLVPFTFIMATIANKGFVKDKVNLIFTANDLEIGGIEVSLVNLLNGINYNKYNVTLILEKKKGSLLKKLNKKIYVKRYIVFNTKIKFINKALNLSKRIIFNIFNYHIYDFSCCYATYSYCGNKLTKIASTNSSIYVHSNYKYVYNDINETKNFFDTRKLDDFRRIIFVSNESRDDYLKLYPQHEKKSLVINNFIDINNIDNKKKEKLGFNKFKNKKLLVFVGRLDENSKKISRLIKIAKEVNEVSVWIIGDGKDKKMYQDMIKEYKLGKRVQMFGSVIDPYNYMDRADYIILTSDYEGFPVVYLEALALKKEIITTFPVSDERINIKERAHIISKNNYISDIRKIIKEGEIKNSEINLKQIQFQRRKTLEKLFDGVI